MGRTKERDGRERRSEGEREGRRGRGGRRRGRNRDGRKEQDKRKHKDGRGSECCSLHRAVVVFILLPAAAAVSHVSYPHRHRLGCFGACHY